MLIVLSVTLGRWDRTTQLSSLGQLLLDKYYRTVRGFLCLIEKEWIHFGHKFGDRLGLNFEDTSYKEAERSPIFLQFLDAVWQIMQQFPHSFEFSDELVMTIMEHAYSGRFGTFLFNCDKERDEHKLVELAPSLWSYILEHVDAFLNPFYVVDCAQEVLYPLADCKALQFWKRFYFQHLMDNPSQLANQYTRLGREMKLTISTLQMQVEEEKKKYLSLETELENLRAQMQKLTTASIPTSHGSLPKQTENNDLIAEKRIFDKDIDDWEPL